MLTWPIKWHAFMLFILGDPAMPRFYLCVFTIAYSSAFNTSSHDGNHCSLIKLPHNLLAPYNSLLLVVMENQPTNCRFIFDCLMSYPNCNLVSNYAGSPRCFSSQDCKMENALSYRNWPENPIMTLFPMDGVILEVRNRKEGCRACSPVAMVSHVRTFNKLFFQDPTSTSITLLVPSSSCMT
jgi:hypothetical protein